MKRISCTTILLFAFFALPLMAQREKTSIYGFGFSGSFTDSIVYITDFQTIEDVEIEKKSRLLISRELYSVELKNYIESTQGLPNRTCVLFYDTKKNRAYKKFLKITKQYQKEHQVVVKTISTDDFKFKPITTTIE